MSQSQLAGARQELLRDLPSVDKLLHRPEVTALTDQYGRSLTVEALRNALTEQRAAIIAGEEPVGEPEGLVQAATAWLESLLAPTLKPVINGTGIIVHTNLGRAPLSRSAIEAVRNVAAGYSSLEYDLEQGERGSRAVHVERLVTQLTGASAALVVNNNAAGVLLMLTALCRGREVIISRGQLVEIGGGFRVPDVMAQSGAKLVEVGTTNRTHLRDYESAINENTAAILVVHHSNYKIVGFTSEPSLAELAELAQARQVALLFDQGSGGLLDVTQYGLAAEPSVQGGLQAGCDVVAFSGDKLLGGPQAGILCGRLEIIQLLKRHPLARAVRADKMCLAALSATMAHYLAGRAVAEIPVWRMIARSLADIKAEAEQWAAQLQAQGMDAVVIESQSKVGGGSLPGTSLPTAAVAIRQENVGDLAAALRRDHVPVVGRIQDNQLLIDPRTVLPFQADALLEALVSHGRKKQSGQSPGTR